MRENDGRKLDHWTLEQIRIRAARQIVDEGANADDIAVALGMSRSAVFGWAQKYRTGGVDALRAKPVPGRPPKVAEDQRAMLYGLIANKDPRMYGFRFALWTREMVRQLIAQRLDTNLSVASVGKLLRTMGMSPQRPLHRAYQQDAEAVEKWRCEVFPAIRDEAAKAGARIFFGDEASVRSDYHAGTTWAPVGQTPVVIKTGERMTVNMISAISTAGDIHFDLFGGRCNSATFIEFCTKLLHDTDGPIFLIVDGASYHHSQAVREYVASTEERLRIIRFPSYSPELNPDEWVWRNVKTHTVGRSGVIGKGQMHSVIIEAIDRLRSIPAIIQGFFKDPSLAYITA